MPAPPPPPDAWTPAIEVGSTRPELAGSFGMVASTHWIASQVGMSVLERGGNAVDAAVAAGFTLQVVEPHLCGPGGEVPAIVCTPDGEAHVVCGQGVAPAAASLAAFADLGLDAVPGTGLLAATVPGAFGGWLTLLERWGTWPLRRVLEPAIGYARDGVPALPRVAHTLSSMAPYFRAHWPTSAQAYLAGDGPPADGGRLHLPGVAHTYERVLAEAEAAGSEHNRHRQIEAARTAWYSGFVAEAIGRFCSQTAWADSTGERHRGFLDAEDLARWTASVEPAVTLTYGGIEVLKCGPWSQGPVLLQQLGLLAALGLTDGVPARDDDGAVVHALVEAQKLAYADREAWYGDPLAVDVPLKTLLSGDYAQTRARLVDANAASFDLRPGSPDGRPPHMAPLATAGQGLGGDGDDAGAGTGEPAVRRVVQSGDTCHVDVVDRHGLLVSATPSGGWLQSSPVIPDLGFPLGSRAQMFHLRPGLASSLRGGIRPRTTLSPTVLRRDGKGWVALGTPGGDQQDQWSLLLVLRLVAMARGPHARLALQAAIDGPALHTENAPSSFYPRQRWPGRVVVENRWPAPGIDGLRRRGHEVVEVDGWSLGRLSAVARTRDGWLRAAANPRGAQGYAVGR